MNKLGCRGWRTGVVVGKFYLNGSLKLLNMLELLNDLDKLDLCRKVKIMQKNWIGKSTGQIII